MAKKAAPSKDFTSVVGLLVKAGHQPRIMKLGSALGRMLTGYQEYAWFPALQIIMSVDSNECVQVRKVPDKGWCVKRNRKNGWFPCSNLPGGDKFAELMEPHYNEYLVNEIMLGDNDAAANSERSGVQGSPGAQEA